MRERWPGRNRSEWPRKIPRRSCSGRCASMRLCLTNSPSQYSPEEGDSIGMQKALFEAAARASPLTGMAGRVSHQVAASAAKISTPTTIPKRLAIERCTVKQGNVVGAGVRPGRARERLDRMGPSRHRRHHRRCYRYCCRATAGAAGRGGWRSHHRRLRYGRAARVGVVPGCNVGLVGGNEARDLEGPFR